MEMEKRSLDLRPFSLSGPIGQFAIKSLVVVVAAVVLLSFAFSLLQGFVDVAVQRAVAEVSASIDARLNAPIGGATFWATVEKVIADQADPKSDIPSEKKRKIVAEIRAIADRWRPFLEEISAAVAGTPAPPPQTSNQ